MSWYEGLKAGAAPKDAKDDTHYQWDFCQQRRKVLATQCLAEPKLYISKVIYTKYSKH